MRAKVAETHSVRKDEILVIRARWLDLGEELLIYLRCEMEVEVLRVYYVIRVGGEKRKYYALCTLLSTHRVKSCHNT